MLDDLWDEFEELAKSADFRYQMLGCPSEKAKTVGQRDRMCREGMKQRRREIKKIRRLTAMKHTLEKVDYARVRKILQKYHPLMFKD
jgi:hypothetical protein